MKNLVVVLCSVVLCLSVCPILEAQYPTANTIDVGGPVVVVERVTIQGEDSWLQTITTGKGPVKVVCNGQAVTDCSSLVSTPYGVIPAVLYHGQCLPLFESVTTNSHLWACRSGGYGYCRITQGYLKGSPFSGFITPIAETSESCE